MSQCHQNTVVLQRSDHRIGALQFRSQGHQGDLLFKASDALLQCRETRWGQMLQRVCTATGFCQKRTFQVSTQQPAAAGLVQAAGLAQHPQGLSQRFDATGHQRWCNGLHTIGPELIEQFDQAWQIVAGEFGKGQSQPAVDLQIDAPWTYPVSRPGLAGQGIPPHVVWFCNSHGLDVDNLSIAVQVQPVALIRRRNVG